MLIFISLVCNCCCHSFLQETMFCFCANLFLGESYGAAVWQIPELYGQLNSPQLEKIASLDASSCKIKWFVVFDSQFHAIYLWMKRMNRKPTSFIETLLVELHSVLWSPSGRHDKLISIDEQNVFLWSLDSSKKAVKLQSQESAGMLHYLSGGAWDPHDVNVVASTCESSIQFWDLRTMKYVTFIVQHFHYFIY